MEEAGIVGDSGATEDAVDAAPLMVVGEREAPVDEATLRDVAASEAPDEADAEAKNEAGDEDDDDDDDEDAGVDVEAGCGLSVRCLLQPRAWRPGLAAAAAAGEAAAAAVPSPVACTLAYRLWHSVV